MSQDIKPTPLGTIAYDANTTVVWLPVDKSNPKRPVNCHQELQFTFQGPGRVQGATIVFAPQSPTTPASPFGDATAMTLTKSPLSTDDFDYFTTPAVTAKSGTWDYAISFMAQTIQNAEGASTVSTFYYLPDPELAVGPGPGSDGPA